MISHITSPICRATSHVRNQVVSYAASHAKSVFNEALSSAASQACETFQNFLKSNPEKAFEDLKKAFEEGNPEEIQHQAERAVSIIGQMLSGIASSLHLEPLLSLEAELKKFLVSQTFSIESLKPVLEKAQEFVVREGDGLNLLEESSPSPSLKFEKHPLTHLIALINYYEIYDKGSTLPQVQQKDISRALRHVDQFSLKLKGIEEFVYSENQSETLEPSQVKKSVLDFIKGRMPDLYVEAFKEKVADEGWTPPDLRVFGEKIANSEQDPMNNPEKLVEEIDNAIYFFKQDPERLGIEKGTIDRVSGSVLKWILSLSECAKEKFNDSNQIRELLHKGSTVQALSQFKKAICLLLDVPIRDEQEKSLLEKLVKQDTFLKLSDLAESLKTPLEECENGLKNPIDLLYKIDDAIYFFNQDPKNHGIEQGVIDEIFKSFDQWTQLFYECAKGNKPSKNTTLETEIGVVRSDFTRGNTILALLKFKEEIEKSRLLQKKVNPQANTLNSLIDNQKATLSKDEPLSDHDAHVKQETDSLVLKVASLATFKMFYSKPSQDLSTDEDTVYTTIMQSVDRAEVQNREETFFIHLKGAIDERRDLNFAKKIFLKSTMRIFFGMVNFFLARTLSSLVEYLSKTISIPENESLGDAQLSFVKRANECFKAHLISTEEWKQNRRSYKYRTMSQQDVIALCLEDPNLNGGYTPRELIKQTAKCALGAFFTLDGLLSEGIRKRIYKIEESVSLSSGITYKIKAMPALFLLSLVNFMAKGLEKLMENSSRFALKRLLLHSELPVEIFASMRDSMYNKSKYASVLDEFFIEQLNELEESLDKGLGTSNGYQEGGGTAKAEFSSLIHHVLELLDVGNVENQIVENIKNRIIEKVSESLMIAYESALKRENATTLALKILRLANKTLSPQSTIRGYYSESDQKKFEEKLGRKIEDSDLKYLFAFKKDRENDVHERLEYLHKIEEKMRTYLEGKGSEITLDKEHTLEIVNQLKLGDAELKKLIAIEKKPGGKRPDNSEENLERLFKIQERFEKHPTLLGLISLFEIEQEIRGKIKDSDLENLPSEMTKEGGWVAALEDRLGCKIDKNYQYPSNDAIKCAIKVKYRETEMRLKKKADQVIEKGTNQIIQVVSDSYLSCPVSHMIDFLEVEVFKRSGYKSNFFKQMGESLDKLKEIDNGLEKEKEIKLVNETLLKFLQECSKRQKMLGEKQYLTTKQTSDYAKQIDRILNENVLPHLEEFSLSIQCFSDNQKPENLERAKKALETFREATYSCQAKLEKVKEKTADSIEQAETPISERLKPLAQKGAVFTLEEVEPIAQNYVKGIANNLPNLYKQSSSFESFLRHVMMLNFVESQGFRKRV